MPQAVDCDLFLYTDGTCLLYQQKDLDRINKELINPFVPNAPFLYPQKTENPKVFWCFQEIDKGYIGNQLGWKVL